MRKITFFMTSIVLVLSTIGCSNEDVLKEKQHSDPLSGREGLTEFLAYDDGLTRTTGTYSGTGVNFFWTADDNLWVNKGTETAPSLVNNSKNNINKQLDSEGKKQTATANFYFPGEFTKDKYIVRYTGKNSSRGDNIKIAKEQSQKTPNNAFHIGTDGDCGTGTATKKDGRYEFMLNHKASYLTFLPFTTQQVLSKAKVTKIKITANRTLAGTYEFTDAGINTLKEPADASKSITIALNNGSGFSLPGTANAETNAAIAVLAPGSYSLFTVEYTVYDPQTSLTFSIEKTYQNLIFNAGKNKTISSDLRIMDFTPHFDNYYMWDAVNSYWFGKKQPDNFHGSRIEAPSDNSWPQSKEKDPGRWYNTAYNENHVIMASQSCAESKGIPTYEAMTWYVGAGDPHTDWDTYWVYKNKLFRGGLWLKKQSSITGFSTTTPYTNAKPWKQRKDYKRNNVPTGRPEHIGDYFFLPALGIYNNGTLKEVGEHGYYWSSSPTADDEGNATQLEFVKGSVTVNTNEDRDHGLMVRKFE